MMKQVEFQDYMSQYGLAKSKGHTMHALTDDTSILIAGKGMSYTQLFDKLCKVVNKDDIDESQIEFIEIIDCADTL